MKKFQLVNNITGWIVFIIASAVYLMTIEPTASFWDCGEFITSAFKLEVGHPPGAPFFMLVGNIVAHLTDAAHAAKMVNSMSAVASGLTILFLFWSITHMARRMLVKEEEKMTLAQTILILGCGIVGSLAYTFSDTFWFSAVEGEVYASSSLFTAVVFWLILKWEEHADQPHADRWIVLIAYLMGLSIGVHLLNLLCIPAIVLVYYYKKYPHPTIKGTIYSLLISFAIVAIMMYGIVQGLVEICGYFELLFVNVFGMPYNTGVYIYVIVIAGLLIWAIWETMREQTNVKRMKIAFILSVVLLGIPFIGSGYLLGVILTAALVVFMFKYKKINVKVLNTILISLMVIVIGYSSFALILIRATADTPMNQNNPRDVFTLRTYLAREQYGKTPLLYGRTFVSEVKRENKGRYSIPVTTPGVPTWTRVIKDSPSDKDRYFISSNNDEYVFIEETCMLFPRMYSNEDSHISFYKQYVEGTPVKINASGETKTVMKPTLLENISFFFDYQLNYMYWRYFMWNFAGRQNDIQGCSGSDILHGNWVTGIKFFDKMRLGPQDNMPFDIAHNKGHNVFYMLPLLLGLIGIFYQVFGKGERGVQGFLVTFFLFFMMGIAIVLYLNQTPYQPRERDYAYAGSFYAFCIWIGIGVAGISKLLHSLKLPTLASSIVATLACVLVPIQMASQTWDDHDRSGRYMCRDFASNYLESCEPEGIIFTHGDNDTFPLWYAQEVEGIRTDVRVCNTSYLQTDWYINQMKRQAYNSEPLPISMTYKEYIGNKRNVIYLMDQIKEPIGLGTAINFVKSDDPKHKIDYGSERLDYIPSTNLVIKIDSDAIVKNHVVNTEYNSYILKEMPINLAGKSTITKFELIMLDMLSTNQWKRPIYYAATVPRSIYSFYENNMQKTGLAFQVVPLNIKDMSMSVNTEKMYDNVMNKFRWGGLEKPGLYLDQNVMNMCKSQRSVVFADLANALIYEGKRDSALKVLDRCVEAIPEENVPYDYSAAGIANLYFELGQNEKAEKIMTSILEKGMTNVGWMFRLKPSLRENVMSDLKENLSWMQSLLKMCYNYDQQYAQSYMERFNEYMKQYENIPQSKKQ